MEYATLGQAANAQLQRGGDTARANPELGRLKAVAERIAIATGQIDGLLYRFHGPRPEAGCGATAPQPPETYRNDIDTIFDALARLEQSSAALDSIG